MKFSWPEAILAVFALSIFFITGYLLGDTQAMVKNMADTTAVMQACKSQCETQIDDALSEMAKGFESMTHGCNDEETDFK